MRLYCSNCGSGFLTAPNALGPASHPICPACHRRQSPSLNTPKPKPGSSRKKAASPSGPPGPGLAPAETYRVPPAPKKRARKKGG